MVRVRPVILYSRFHVSLLTTNSHVGYGSGAGFCETEEMQIGIGTRLRLVKLQADGRSSKLSSPVLRFKLLDNKLGGFISRPGNSQPCMLKLAKHLKILSFRRGNYNFAFICTEQCYALVSYKFEQRFPIHFFQFKFIQCSILYETTSVSTSDISKTLKKKKKKNVALENERRKKYLRNLGGQGSQHVPYEKWNLLAVDRPIVNPQTLSETAFFRKMPRVFAEGTRVA